MNLVSSATDFAHITPVISDLTKIEFLWPCSSAADFANITPVISGLTKIEFLKDLDQSSVDTYWWHI